MLVEDPFQRFDFIQIRKKLVEKGYWDAGSIKDLSPSYFEDNNIDSLMS